MRLLFISPNRLRLIAPPLPLGLASLVASVAQEHEVRVLDFMFLAEPLKEVRRVVADFQPELIAMSLRNIDNQDCRNPITYFPENRELVKEIRAISPAPILLGGGGYSILPRQLLEYVEPDWGLAGEGEEVFKIFLKTYATRNWAEIPGLGWREGEAWRLNPPQPVQALERLEAPALEQFTPKLYHEALGSAKLPGAIPVQSRRGCPMQCIYCTTPLLEGRCIRAWPPEVVASWLKGWHERWGLTRFYFVDNIFNHPLDYALSLCRAIEALKLPLEWGCLINPAFPDRELFRCLRRSGCTMVQVGNESGSELMLANLGKGFGREQVESTLQMLQDEGLPFFCFLMFGGPGETRETVADSVAFLEKYQPQMVNLTVGVRIYPGLPLHRRALEEGVLAPGDDLLCPRFYLSPAIQDWIWEYLPEVSARHPNWIF